MSKQKNTTTPIGADEVMSDDDIDGKTCPVLCFSFPLSWEFPFDHSLTPSHPSLGFFPTSWTWTSRGLQLFIPPIITSLLSNLLAFTLVLSLYSFSLMHFCVCVLFISLEPWFFCSSFLLMWKWNPIGLSFPWWVQLSEKRERRHLDCIGLFGELNKSPYPLLLYDWLLGVGSVTKFNVKFCFFFF